MELIPCDCHGCTQHSTAQWKQRHASDASVQHRVQADAAVNSRLGAEQVSVLLLCADFLASSTALCIAMLSLALR